MQVPAHLDSPLGQNFNLEDPTNRIHARKAEDGEKTGGPAGKSQVSKQSPTEKNSGSAVVTDAGMKAKRFVLRNFMDEVARRLQADAKSRDDEETKAPATDADNRKPVPPAEQDYAVRRPPDIQIDNSVFFEKLPDEVTSGEIFDPAGYEEALRGIEEWDVGDMVDFDRNFFAMLLYHFRKKTDEFYDSSMKNSLLRASVDVIFKDIEFKLKP